MSEVVELIAATFLKVREGGFRLAGRNSGQWFLDCDALPAGEFAAGPFPSKAEAALAADRMTALATIDALSNAGFAIVPRDPTEAMAEALSPGLCEVCNQDCWPGPTETWQTMIDEAPGR